MNTKPMFLTKDDLKAPLSINKRKLFDDFPGLYNTLLYELINLGSRIK